MLANYMGHSDASACQLWKGYTDRHSRYGWWMKRWGEHEAAYLGRTVAAVRHNLDELEDK